MTRCRQARRTPKFYETGHGCPRRCVFFRVKHSGGHPYLQLVENRRVGFPGRETRQTVLASLGRLDRETLRVFRESLERIERDEFKGASRRGT